MGKLYRTNRQILIFVLLIFCCGYVIPTPPKIDDKIIYEYFKILYGKINILQVVTTNPNGNQTGRYGQAVILLSGGSYYLEVCTSSPNGTVWRGVALTATP